MDRSLEEKGWEERILRSSDENEMPMERIVWKSRGERQGEESEQKMEPIGVLERAKGDEERRRRDQAEGFLYDCSPADDEFSKLMSSLERQFEAFDDDEGTLNFLGEIKNTAQEESFCQNFEKENVVPERNAIRKAGRPLGSVQVATSRPINFSRLKSIRTVPAPFNSFYGGITTVLKENVNKAQSAKESQVVDDFWSTEMEKKMSAVARRNLTGSKMPAEKKPKAVQDRNVRHARSRRGEGNSRRVGRRPSRLNPRLDTIKAFEWDQETLAEEEVPPSNGALSCSSISAGSRCSHPGMKMGPCQSPVVEMRELLAGVEHAKIPRQSAGRAHAGFPVQESNLHIQWVPLTSPTPPSNPVAVAMSLKHLEGDVRLRRHSFHSLSSGAGIDTDGGRDESREIRAEWSTLNWKTCCRTSRKENELLTISRDYLEDDECTFAANEHGTQILPNELREDGDFDAAPPHVDAHHIPLGESSAGTDGKQQRRAKRTPQNLHCNLKGCGSTWKEGRRKSQRNRVGPLEWWRGEKVLYAVHDSLMTVVGICRR